MSHNKHALWISHSISPEASPLKKNVQRGPNPQSKARPLLRTGSGLQCKVPGKLSRCACPSSYGHRKHAFPHLPCFRGGKPWRPPVAALSGPRPVLPKPCWGEEAEMYHASAAPSPFHLWHSGLWFQILQRDFSWDLVYAGTGAAYERMVWICAHSP